MKKIIPNIAGIILGGLFLMASVTYFLKLMPTPEFPAGSPIAMFNAAMMPTGYTGFVKACELLGGLLVAIPRTRNFGLLLLCPIIANIIVFHATIMGGEGLFSWMLIAIVLLTLVLLWCGRDKFKGLLN